MMKQLVRSLGGVVALGLAFSLGGCETGAAPTFNGHRGVPLADLDLSGNSAPEITLLGPDAVKVITGGRLAISVEGDQAVKDRLRFVLRDGKLGIGRQDNGWNSEGIATVTVIVPDVRDLVLAGSGTIDVDALRGDKVGVTVAGSGTVQAQRVDAGQLDVAVLGSGTLKATGQAQTLGLKIAGSGAADMANLDAANAKVDVAGSGDARFASNGNVDANIMGSGEVRVRGRATCKVTAMGSGRLVCEP